MSAFAFKTMAGISLQEALELLQVVLPPQAYKAVPGTRVAGPDGRDRSLTDINPAFLVEKATQAFGPAGIGWWYVFDPDRQQTEQITKKKRGGGTYQQWRAVIPQFRLFFAYVDENSEMQTSKPILSSGASDNADLGYAIRGSITNAIAAAFAKLLWQNDVYKGQLHHENAAGHFKAQAKAKEKQPTAQSDNTEQDLGTNGNPGAFIIPFGNNEGKQLSDVSQRAVKWYAQQMVPKNPEGEALQKAATAYLDALALVS